MSDDDDSDSDDGSDIQKGAAKHVDRPLAPVTNALRVWQYSAEWVQLADVVGAADDANQLASS